MGDSLDSSPEFSDFFFLAIDHGFESIQDGSGPLIPFTLTLDREGKRSLTRFAADRLEKGVELAKKSIDDQRQHLKMYAIAWDGYITVDGQKWDGILVEAGEEGKETGLLFCQRYVRKGKSWFTRGKNERFGNPALIGHPQSRLSF